jgi:hypothetical protein
VRGNEAKGEAYGRSLRSDDEGRTEGERGSDDRSRSEGDTEGGRGCEGAVRTDAKGERAGTQGASTDDT